MLRREVGVQKPLLTRDILFVFEDNIWLYRYIQEEQKLYLSDASFEEFRCGPSVTFDAFGDPAPGISRDVGESSLTFFVLGRDVDTATWCGSKDHDSLRRRCCTGRPSVRRVPCDRL
jgi:hypothetical protein